MAVSGSILSWRHNTAVESRGRREAGIEWGASGRNLTQPHSLTQTFTPSKAHNILTLSCVQYKLYYNLDLEWQFLLSCIDAERM